MDDDIRVVACSEHNACDNCFKSPKGEYLISFRFTVSVHLVSVYLCQSCLKVAQDKIDNKLMGY